MNVLMGGLSQVKRVPWMASGIYIASLGAGVANVRFGYRRGFGFTRFKICANSSKLYSFYIYTRARFYSFTFFFFFSRYLSPVFDIDDDGVDEVQSLVVDGRDVGR